MSEVINYILKCYIEYAHINYIILLDICIFMCDQPYTIYYIEKILHFQIYFIDILIVIKMNFINFYI